MQDQPINDHLAMQAVVTVGTGGYEMLEYKRVPRPVAGKGELLLKVLAAGVNNTDINTRLGWYSSSVTQGTGETTGPEDRQAGGWKNATPFPLIQGADCCGEVVSAGAGGDATGNEWDLSQPTPIVPRNNGEDHDPP